MGLDTYAVTPVKDGDNLWVEADPAHFAGVGPLVGGLFSGNGNSGSFRGKVYSHIISELTGVSLYQEYIAPEIVAQMADRLDAAADFEYAEDTDDMPALRAFFDVCRTQGYGLVGWW